MYNTANPDYRFTIMQIRLSLLAFIIAACWFTEVSAASSLSIDELTAKAQSGDLDSQLSLALMYQLGRSVPKDYNQSIMWYTKAAEQGSAKAQYELGQICENGRGTVQNYIQAFQWYAQAAVQEYAKAQYSLALLYSKGLGVGRDYPEAAAWFARAANQGLADAQYQLGLMYYKGTGIEQDDSLAEKWLTKAAMQNNAKAQYQLGLLYCKDRGDEKPHNYKEAVRWFSKAGAAGNIDAQYLLGVMYCRAEGVPQDYKTAAKWFIKAASQGSTRAQLVLGACYWNGKGVNIDYAESLKWMSLASMNGDKDAKWLKEELREKMSPAEIEDAQKRINRVTKLKGYLVKKDAPKGDPAGFTANSEITSTGFFITSDGYILTANHSVGKSGSVNILYNQKKYPAQVIAKNDSIDAAILKIDGNDFSYLPISPDKTAQTGDLVFTMGYPQISLQGTEPKFTEGSISALSGTGDNPQFFQISVPVQPGNSGGPLVNDKGEVIGLIIARLNDISALMTTGTVPQNVNYALKSSIVLSFLQTIPDLPAKIKSHGFMQDRTAAIDRAKKSVVLITSYN
ncbi:MAG: hypothetical protein A2Y10_11810 [Planctomycetes bacterium GWF2_41_51]|nr:MAG: hypothetical protein A2Y10_11810 [Planctomycetes bacterium GWF2_41_51]